MSSRSKSSPLSYTAKRQFIRQFDSAPSGRLTKSTKAKITRRYNQLANLDKNTALRFKSADRAQRQTLSESGYKTTAKGVFLPQRKRERVTLLKSAVKHQSESRAVKRTEYEFPLSPQDINDLLNDVNAFLKTLANRHKRIFNAHKGERRFYRLVWSLGSAREEMTLLKLESYIRRAQEQAIRSTKRNIDLLTAKQRKERFKNTVIAIRIIFIKSKQKRRKRK